MLGKNSYTFTLTDTVQLVGTFVSTYHKCNIVKTFKVSKQTFYDVKFKKVN